MLWCSTRGRPVRGLSMAPDAAIWQVGVLCRAIAGELDARFNPVAVRGEISGFSRAASGHCYFQLKDADGQLRCAMFRRAATLLDFSPRDGDLVEVRGRLGVYEPRGDLQLIVESLRKAGQGTLFEQFLQRKERLQAQGLFDAARKRPLPLLPRGIGVVTSPGAAAWHDVMTALRRRLPHIPVLLAPASVQGDQAPGDLVRALHRLYAVAEQPDAAMPIDVILLVRGGGSIEDLWAFNDEQLAQALARSPVPVVCGVGHETDFTIADFVADLRAPTPTAAAELVAQPREVWLGALDLLTGRLRDAVERGLDQRAQQLDRVVARLGRPSQLMARQQLRLSHVAQRLRHAAAGQLATHRQGLTGGEQRLHLGRQSRLERAREGLQHAQRVLDLLDPHVVLRRGYAWLTDERGATVTSIVGVRPGDRLRARLADGTLDLMAQGAARGSR